MEKLKYIAIIALIASGIYNKNSIQIIVAAFLIISTKEGK